MVRYSILLCLRINSGLMVLLRVAFLLLRVGQAITCG